ncbi:hypothetical protein D0B88_18765 [Cellvibrio sp. KY-YJ-3]|nr:hypothetical protein D0B88_18765 [Cellvibrio sp. KY-YJ-3]
MFSSVYCARQTTQRLIINKPHQVGLIYIDIILQLNQASLSNFYVAITKAPKLRKRQGYCS